MNGGTGPVPPNSIDYTPGATGQVADASANMIKAGSLFNGWNTQANGTGVNYNTQSAVMTSDLTLYAKWI